MIMNGTLARARVPFLPFLGGSIYEPPEFGSSPTNETRFPRKNAARRARGISFEGNPFTTIRTYKSWGSSYKGSPPKLYPCAQRRDFLDAQCGSTELLQKSLVPRSPAKRNPEPHFPHGEAMRFADAKRVSASFLQNARRGRIHSDKKKTAPRAARTLCARAGVPIFYAEKRGSLYETP